MSKFFFLFFFPYSEGICSILMNRASRSTMKKMHKEINVLAAGRDVADRLRQGPHEEPEWKVEPAIIFLCCMRRSALGAEEKIEFKF